jgi:hypothetical protein
MDPPIAQDRALVRDVLAGVVGEDTHRSVFEDDVLLFCVRRLERDDPAWLLAALAEPGLDPERRTAVLACLGDLRAEAVAMLRNDPP